MIWNQKSLYYNIVLPYTFVLEDLEWYGMRIDLKELDNLKNEFEQIKFELETQIYQHIGKINIRSSAQKSESVFSYLKIPKFVDDYKLEKGTWIKTKDYLLTDGGKEQVFKHGADPERLGYEFYSLKKSNLYKLREVYQHPVFQLLIDYSEINKLLTSYIYSLLNGNSKGEQLLFGDRVYPSYFAYTMGGRIRADGPAVLTIPSRSDIGKKIKRLFIPDSDEYGFVRLDYSAIELRFLAWLAKERTMLKAFAEGVDLHALTASNIKEFKITYEQACDPKYKLQRFYGKTTNFTLTYLGTYYSLQETFLEKGIFVDKKTCWNFQNGYFNTYKDIKPYHENIERAVLNHGYVQNLFGRRRYFSGVKGLHKNKENRKIIHEAVKSAVSHVVSGSSTGDYVPLKILGSLELIKQKKFDARLWLNLHDGLIYQVRKNQIGDFAEIMEKYLKKPESPVTIDLPLETKIDLNSWGTL